MWEPEENIKENYHKEKEKRLKKRNTKHKRRRKLPLEDFKPKPRDVTKRRIECLMARNNQKYLVKWENLPDDENTWEHKSSIPKTMLKVRSSYLYYISVKIFPLFYYLNYYSIMRVTCPC